MSEQRLEDQKMEDAELENQLKEAGRKLTSPSSSVEELLSLLDEIDLCLSKVEQSPSLSMQDALAPSKSALVSNELLKHSDVDVKVYVASCVSEITRITAPDAPYGDEEMKEIFQVIVAAFEKLYDMSSRSFEKRVSILETVAKVRSCVVMLDLECDGLILEMFQHFLKAIRDEHPEKVFTSMETIMSLVLEESEEISADLISPLLASVKRANKDVLPIARKLGEKVLESCTAKLKPYLMQALRVLDTSPNDYSKIVAKICDVTPDAIEHNDDSAPPEEILVAEESEPAVSCPEEDDPVRDQQAKSVMSNGDAETEKEKVASLVGIESPEVQPESSLPTVLPANAEPDSLESNVIQLENKVVDQPTKKKRGQKPNSSVQKAEPSSQVDNCKETSDVPGKEKSPGKEVDMPDKEKSHDKEADESPEENETLPLAPSPSASRDKPVKVASPPVGQSLPASRSKRGRPPKVKKVNTSEDTDHDSHLQSEVQSSSDAKKGAEGKSDIDAKSQKHSGKKTLEKEDEDDVDPAKDADAISESETKPVKRSRKKVYEKQHGKGNENDATPIKDAGVTSDSETKPLRRSGKKINAKDGREENVGPTKDASGASDSEKPQKRSGKKATAKDVNEDTVAPTKDVEVGSDSETKPPRRSGKRVNVKDGTEDESSEKKGAGKGKRGKGTPTTKSDEPGESTNKKIGSSSKSTPKGTPKNQIPLDETSKSTSKRKRSTGKKEVSEINNSVEDGENLVGANIQVWWPDDEMFYEGVVESFDPVEKKHKVSYVDGDQEILVLKDEKWQFVDTTKQDGEEAIDLPSPDASESHQKKKIKTDSDSSKQAKTDTSSKRGKGASTSKAKDEGTKVGGKTKDEAKVEGKNPKAGNKSRTDNLPKSETPKTKSKADKSKDDTPKAGTKSKDDTPKAGNKSKDTPKTGSKSKGTKSKGDTPKTGTKSKDETRKAGTKSKEMDETPKPSAKSKSTTSKAGSQSKANGTTPKSKAGASKVEESDDSPKGKPSGSAANSKESEPKGSNKRKRKAAA